LLGKLSIKKAAFAFCFENFFLAAQVARVHGLVRTFVCLLLSLGILHSNGAHPDSNGSETPFAFVTFLIGKTSLEYLDL